MILLTGGSACGKSTYAELLAARMPGPRWYIAAMEPFGEESERRIARHRAQRADMGFFTVERHTDLAGLILPAVNEIPPSKRYRADKPKYPAGSERSGVLFDPFSFKKKDRGIALLECVCNLSANEMFKYPKAPLDAVETAETVTSGVEALAAQCSELIVVTNEVGSDGGGYDELSMRWVEAMGIINRALAARADTVLELVCGIPLVIKGVLP